MSIPEKLPFLRGLTLIWAAYGLLWISLEGGVATVVAMGVGTTAVSVLRLLQRYLGGRQVRLGVWLGGTAVVGTAAAAIAVGVTFFFMAMKTGLHAHGPEFSPAQIQWLWAQLPLWMAIGGAVSLGLGLLLAGLQTDE